MIEWPDLNFVVCVYFNSLFGWARQSAPGSICRSRIVLKLSSDPSCAVRATHAARGGPNWPLYHSGPVWIFKIHVLKEGLALNTS